MTAHPLSATRPSRLDNLNRRTVILGWLLFVLGLLFRFGGLFFNGMHDLDQIILEWGARVHEVGLAHTPIRIYGLLSYFFHGLAFDLAYAMPRFWWAPHKFIEIAFELGIYWALMQLLPSRDRGLVLYLYWLNPWFILHGAWLGFWDGPYTLSALLAVLALRQTSNERLGWGLVGILLAVGALFKPQALIYFLVPIGVYLGWLWLIRRQFMTLFAYVLGAIALFVSAALLLALIGGNPLEVPRSYLIGNVMANLCNGCIGLWRPVSRLLMLLLGQTGATYELRLPSQLSAALDLLILAGTMGLVVVFALRVALSDLRAEMRPLLPAFLNLYRIALQLLEQWKARWAQAIPAPIAPYISAYLVLTFASLAIPQLATRAHINHTYAGIVLLIPLAILYRPILVAWGAMVLIHLYGGLANFGIGNSSALPVRDLSNYPPSHAELLALVDPTRYSWLVDFQRGTNQFLSQLLPIEPMLSVLSLIQFAAVVFVIWTLFTQLGQVWKLAED